MISHNTGDQFLIEKRGNREVFLSAQELADMLNVLPSEVPVTIVIEACHSGNFILAKDTLGKPLLPRRGRTVIVSARSDVQAQLSPSLSSFSKTFFDEIDKNKPLGEAFQETEGVLKRVPRHSRQFPQIDANGNGAPNEPIDFREVEKFYIPESLVSLEGEPHITKVITDPTTIPAGKTSARITVTVIGPPGIPSHVYATITPPGYDPSVQFTDWKAYDVPTIEFVPEGEENCYIAEYNQFTTPGNYTIVVFAENPDGSALPVEITITVSEAAKPTAPWDVDGNGTVNILDWVIVAGNFGKSGTGVKGDVNGDGTVNILDLVLVSSHFGERVVVAAPSLDLPLPDLSPSHSPTRRGAMERGVSPFPPREGGWGVRSEPIRLALHALEALPNPSRGAILARDLLREWLAQAEPIVTETKLLPNYPNPFNPETWIPYQLARPAAVSLSIYDTHGRRIRVLDLGQQGAGFYIEPAQAAYWDGRNAWGESVASGVYFYQLKAGDFTATRRMVILK
ncbi:T9SS type A sorting domain-containing protein [Candidatus Poribacteria bacterium]|nr:T9SS type A sorting domain-containing protein [Candidatus Poribacteria bacterium]